MDTTRFKSGDRVGNYILVEVVFQGSRTCVWAARHHERSDTLVAIKLAIDPSLRKQLSNEARLPSVTHPNVVPILDCDTSSPTTPYIVQPLFRRGNLAQFIASHPSGAPEDLVLSALREILAGLAAAHKAGITHRDIKPQNILISDDGHPLIADFGLSRLSLDRQTVESIQQSGSINDSSAIVGSLAYMAPEIVDGGIATPSSDIYSVGVVLFEMLVGTRPSGPEKPSDRRPNLKYADVIDELYVRACRRVDRFSSASEMLALVTKSVGSGENRHSGEYQTSNTESTTVRAGPHRSTSTHWILAVFLAVVVLGFLVYWFNSPPSVTNTRVASRPAADFDFDFDSRTTESKTGKLQDTNENKKEGSPTANGPDGQLLEYARPPGTWANAVRFSDDGEWIIYGGGGLPGSTSETRRSRYPWEWSYHFDDGVAATGRRFGLYPGQWMDLEFFDSDRSIVGATQSRLVIWSRKSGGLLKKFVWPMYGDPGITCCCKSPKSTRIAFGWTNSVVRYEEKEDRPHVFLGLWNYVTDEYVLLPHEERVRDICFLPDSDLLTVVGDNSSTQIWNVTTKESVRSLNVFSGTVWCSAVTPDGLKLATGSQDGVIRIWDLSSLYPPIVDTSNAEPVISIDAHKGPVSALAIPKNGHFIASGSVDGTIGIWDPETGNLLRRFVPNGGTTVDIDAHATGMYVVSSEYGEDGKIRLWSTASNLYRNLLEE